jgi:hypothetical protein
MALRRAPGRISFTPQTGVVALNHVVYLHRHNGTPILAGAGLLARASNFQAGRNKPYLDHVAEHGKPQVEIVERGLTKDEAHQREIELIARYGRVCDGGTLLNISTGGRGPTGCVRDNKTRARMSKASRNRSSEAREKTRQGNLTYWALYRSRFREALEFVAAEFSETDPKLSTWAGRAAISGHCIVRKLLRI